MSHEESHSSRFVKDKLIDDGAELDQRL